MEVPGFIINNTILINIYLSIFWISFHIKKLSSGVVVTGDGRKTPLLLNPTIRVNIHNTFELYIMKELQTAGNICRSDCG